MTTGNDVRTLFNQTRRQFVQSAIAAGVGLAAMPQLGFSALTRGAPKKILILGGTGFLGPACVDAALAKGHTVTLFNRGVTEKRKGGMYPDLEKLLGDRDPKKGEGLKALEGRKWDAVIDTSAYVPRIAKASAELLAPNVGHYTMISTISVYKDNSKPNADESAELGTVADPTIEEMGSQFENYGPLKALCEQAAEAAMPGRVANVRPGYIVGPGDPTPRFPYWPARFAKGGVVLAPGTPNDPVQVIDVRDLGEWVIHLIEQNTVGVFNAVGPKGGMNMKAYLDGIKKGVGGDATFIYADMATLEKAQVGLPICIPPVAEYAGFHTRNAEKAFNAGLKSRDISVIAKDTLDWLNGLPEDKRSKLIGALPAEKEKEILDSMK